jgi:hypothetical protein
MAGWSDALQDAEREMWDDVVAAEKVTSDEVASEYARVEAEYTDYVGGGTVTSTYGAVEVNTITEEQKLFQQSANEVVDLADKRLARITRLRLVTDRDFPMWDLSYCYGVLKDGAAVRVRFPQSQFTKSDLNRDLIDMCKAEGVFGKGLGIFDPEVISKLYG